MYQRLGNALEEAEGIRSTVRRAEENDAAGGFEYGVKVALPKLAAAGSSQHLLDDDPAETVHDE